MSRTVPLLGDPRTVGSPQILHRLARSRIAAVVWTVARVWLGIQWIQAGMAKLWGAENPAFLHHNGAGVAGYATHGAASYSWWHHFLTGFVAPNSGWIGIFIAVTEFSIGVALVLGVFTPGFALGGLLLNLTYLFSGTAGVNPMFAILSVVLIAAWRTSGWIGVDGIVMGIVQRRRRSGQSPPDVDLTTSPAGVLPVPPLEESVR